MGGRAVLPEGLVASQSLTGAKKATSVVQLATAMYLFHRSID